MVGVALLLGNLFHHDRRLLWRDVRFELSVHLLPASIVGKLRAHALARTGRAG